ncbi:MAG TPA: hypothetical protein VGG38_20875 [Acidimicrobiales bacterium]|jgi:hypothetical protein
MTTWTDEALDRALATHNPVPPDQVGDSAERPESVSLLAQVIADDGMRTRPVPLGRRRRRIRVIAVAAAAAIVAAGVVTLSTRGTPGQSTGSAQRTHGTTIPDASLVDFSTESNGDIVARITDPDAAASQLDAVLLAHHLDISVTVLPVSPSLVGTIVFSDQPSGENIQPIQAGSCLAGGTQCWVGLVIPAGFTGHADVSVGRAAKPGETYASADNSFGPGEALHCAGVFNQPVSVATPLVAAMGLTVEWRVGSSTTNLATAPADDYVVNGIPISPTIVMLMVQATPLPANTPDLINANAGC